MPHAVRPLPHTARLRRVSRRQGFPLGHALYAPQTPLQTLCGGLQTHSVGFFSGQGVKPFLQLKLHGAHLEQIGSALSG